MHQSLPMSLKNLLALAAASALLAACATAPTKNVLPTGTTAGDRVLSPFYAWTGGLPARAGVMLRTEPMALQPEITAGTLQRILYTSTDARWNSGVVPVSGTLYLPKGQPPRGGWPLVAWAHGTLGIADPCAPSWTLHRPRDGAYLNRWLEQGFAVVATDYQGLGGPGPHTYLFWEAEGRSVLDSARAALAANPGRIANVLVITGQSQGSGAPSGRAASHRAMRRIFGCGPPSRPAWSHPFPRGRTAPPKPHPIRQDPRASPCYGWWAARCRMAAHRPTAW